MILCSKSNKKETSRLIRHDVMQMASLRGYYKMTIMYSKREARDEMKKG